MANLKFRGSKTLGVYIFRLAGDMTHFLSMLFLLLKIQTIKSCAGNHYPWWNKINKGFKHRVIISENPDPAFVKSSNFSYAIFVVDEHPYAETAGDSRTTLTMADPGPSVITNVCQAIRCVVIIIFGRPIVLEPYLSSIDAVVASWLPGFEGQGVADVLYGDYGFTGKLPRTWFKRVDQLPMNYGDPHYDSLFPLEFGLKIESLKELVARCGHCKKLALEYEKVGASFKKAKSVLIGTVDCDEHKDVCSKYGISGYHTIQWFPKGSLEPKMYEGAHTVEALAEYVNKKGGTNVKIVAVPSSVAVLSTNNFDEIVLNNIL